MTFEGRTLWDWLQADPLVMYFVPVFVVVIVAEFVLLWRQRSEHYDVPDGLSSIGMGVGSVVLDVLAKGMALALYFWAYQNRLFDGLGGLVPPLWVWALAFLADDFTFYWHHRLCHTVRLFWAGHVNHHSSQRFNFATALRQSWGELFHKFPLWVWMPLLGFHPLVVLMMQSASLIYQFFVHTELVRRLGPLEWVLNTPSHHRVHHARNVRYLDRNHAGVLIVWDRLFGTYTAEDQREPVDYGIRGAHPSRNLFDIATHEYRALWQDLRRARTPREALGYLFGPPGWSPDGSRQTTAQLRAELARTTNTP